MYSFIPFRLYQLLDLHPEFDPKKRTLWRSTWTTIWEFDLTKGVQIQFEFSKPFLYKLLNNHSNCSISFKVYAFRWPFKVVWRLDWFKSHKIHCIRSLRVQLKLIFFVPALPNRHASSVHLNHSNQITIRSYDFLTYTDYN